MAGKILPIALATALGISIGVATFDGEFKEQRRKRLEEEYQREVAALASSKEAIPATPTSSVIPAPPTEQLPAAADTQASASSNSSWSSMLGLWAWNKDAKKVAPPAKDQVLPTTTGVEEAKGKP